MNRPRPQTEHQAGYRQVRLEVNGIVQGVGFRPFLHRIAGQHRITGWVRNTSAGLEGILEGTPTDLDDFLRTVRTCPPPMAQIESLRTTADGSGSSRRFSGFVIRDSRIRSGATLISPDSAMCPDCEAELYDRTDRRYRYPFINCTNCGPRYTIIRALPYDRERTVMAEFAMCPDCEAEYHDISNRRYHAQPDCCGTCGPQISYVPADRPVQSGSLTPAELSSTEDALRRAQELLASGGILAVKGIGGIHLACSALDASAVQRLRLRKHRAEKPLALMCRSMDAVRRICEVTPAEERLLTGPERPIVLLKKKDFRNPQEIPGGPEERLKKALDALSFSPRLGVMLPYTPLHTLLADGAYGGPDILVMTSGNLSGCPVLTDNGDALRLLSGVADGFLLHNRRIENRCDDSLVMEWQGAPYFLRRSRGYAPAPVTLEGADGIFALGAEQKASFALGRESHVFLSPYIGDLKNAETFEHYENALRTYERLFRLKPALYVCDLHPDYLSSQEAAGRSASEGMPLLRVQHHWAHMASCMADNHLDTPCFGIIWDGTGLGTDGAIWGGEFLKGDFSSFRRAGSIRPVLLPGGDRAVREIGRIALALITDAFRDSPKERDNALALVPLEPQKRRMLSALLDGSAQAAPKASSIGRLFDGVCALLLGKAEADYEGEGAALVEARSPAETPGEAAPSALCGDRTRQLAFPLHFYEEDGMRVFDTRPMMRALAAELQKGTDTGHLAFRFLSTLVCMAAGQCMELNPEKLPVVLSGGVFQNRFLLHGVTALLEEKGFTVYTHRRVSTNGEGVCLGQLAVARKKRSMKNYVSGNAHENP